MKLRATDQRQSGLQGKAIRGIQPRILIGKSRVLSGTHRIKMQGSDAHRVVAYHDLNRPFHKEVVVLLIRTRLGSRSSSITSPTSSRRASTKSPNTPPKPNTKSAIA